MRNEALLSYLEGKTLKEFGQQIGRTATAVYYYVNGLRVPPAEMIRAIEETTCGAVPSSSWDPIILAKAKGGCHEA